MAYADQKMSNGRITAIVIVALLHALLGYAFVTGLAYNVVKQVAQDLKTFDVVEEPPPPEEEPPPPPPDQPQQVQPPPVVSPPPIVRVNTPPQQISTVRVAPPAPITYTAPPTPPAPRVAPPPPPPPPAPPRVVEPARAKGSLQGLFREDDYPSAAASRGETGSTRVRLAIGTDGRVTGCTVTGGSGSSSLDRATCSVLRSRARFSPASDNQGRPIGDTHDATITWRLQ
jgi:protein TonB